jgi:hypothetical protein
MQCVSRSLLALTAAAAALRLAYRAGRLSPGTLLSRRRLPKICSLGLTALLTGAGRSRTGALAAGHDLAPRCILSPEQTAGPYYIAREKVRRNITEQHPGTPLALRYFADSLTAKVYQAEPYRVRAAARDTFNNADSIYQNGGRQSMLTMKRDGHGASIGSTPAGDGRVCPPRLRRVR